MNLLSCTINLLCVRQKRRGLAVSRECLLVSDGLVQKLEFAIFDFRFKFSSICKFWSVLCPENENPFILDRTTVEESWTCSAEIYKIFTRFCTNFALPMTFIANTFEETEKLFLLEVSV